MFVKLYTYPQHQLSMGIRLSVFCNSIYGMFDGRNRNVDKPK